MRLFPMPTNIYARRITNVESELLETQSLSGRSVGWLLTTPFTPFDFDLWQDGKGSPLPVDVRDTVLPATTLIRDATNFVPFKWFIGKGWDPVTGEPIDDKFGRRALW